MKLFEGRTYVVCKDAAETARVVAAMEAAGMSAAFSEGDRRCAAICVDNGRFYRAPKAYAIGGQTRVPVVAAAEAMEGLAEGRTVQTAGFAHFAARGDAAGLRVGCQVSDWKMVDAIMAVARKQARARRPARPAGLRFGNYNVEKITSAGRVIVTSGYSESLARLEYTVARTRPKP